MSRWARFTEPPAFYISSKAIGVNRHGNAFVRANTLPIARIFVRDPVLDGSEAVPRRFTYFGAREATIFSKRGSPRSGSQNGSSFKLP